MERSSSSSSTIYARRHHHHRNTDNNNPSFSSTLLDSIYRSFELDSSSSSSSLDHRRGNMVVYRGDKKTLTTSRKQLSHNNNISISTSQQQQVAASARANVVHHKQSGGPARAQNAAFRDSRPDFSTSTSSSESSYGTGPGFSSSDSADDSLPPPRSNLKPIRTAGVNNNDYRSEFHRGGEGFVKKKSRSLKNIYGDLKKAKQHHQPISPGGRLASFLNSLFHAGSSKKAKIVGGGDEIRPSSSSTCSSASSFSRSCLSKTPSSRAASSGKTRSVRFYPVSVIVDEDSRPCGHKNLYGDREAVMVEKEEEVLKLQVMKESRRVEAAARELLKNYSQRKSTTAIDDEMLYRRRGREEEDDDDDGGSSCASSDLFELDNLSAIEGIERYREELPVYETTHLRRAIGFLV